MGEARAKARAPTPPQPDQHGLAATTPARSVSTTLPATSAAARQDWLITRLTEADGPSYDDLCAEVVAAFPDGKTKWFASCKGVREVRWLLWSGLATVESDESVWLTPAGWAAVGES
jgi:hypothetical protein